MRGNNQYTYMTGITPRQREVLEYIKLKLEKDGVCPSFQDIANAMGLKSKSGVFKIVESLIERGYLKNDLGKFKSRGLSLVDHSYENLISVIEGLLGCPDMNHDSLEDLTVDAIHNAHVVLDSIKKKE